MVPLVARHGVHRTLIDAWKKQAVEGMAAVHPRPETTVRHPQHRVRPHLLRDLVVDRPDRVWCSDITCIPMRRGFLHLVAIMDWFGRRVLAWRLSNTMEADVCIEALEEAMVRFGRPAIVNTDQGSQFTSPRFTEVLTGAGLRISMDGRGRWLDQVRVRLPERVRDRIGGARRDRPVDPLPQRPEAALGPGRTNAGGGPHGHLRNPIGGVTET